MITYHKWCVCVGVGVYGISTFRTRVSEERESCRASKWIGESSIGILQFQLPRIATTLSTWNPPSQANGVYPQNCTVDLPRIQVSELHYDKLLDPSTFQCWKTNFKTVWYVIVQVFDVAVNWRVWIPELWNAWCEDCVRPEEDHHEPILQEDCQSGGATGTNGRPFSPWETDCVFDLRILSGNWGSWRCSRSSRRILCHFTWRLCSGFWYKDGIKLCYLQDEMPKDNVLESVYKMRTRESDQLRTVLRTSWSRSIEAELSEVEDHVATK